MVAARALTVPDDHKLNEQPIFCFETMMHMLYWSSIVYDYKRVRCCTKAMHYLWQRGNDWLCCAALCYGTWCLLCWYFLVGLSNSLSHTAHVRRQLLQTLPKSCTVS